MELAYPPFETKDDAGNPSGLSVDFMRDFGDAYGYDVEIQNTGWDGLIPSLQTGKADLVISSMTITPEREEAVGFSDPYARAQLAILANSASGASSIEDLDQPDKTVAVFIPFQDPEYWGVAVAKGNRELLDQLNEFIAQSRQDGEFDRLTQAYLPQEKAAFDDLGFAWFFDLDDAPSSAADDR